MFQQMCYSNKDNLSAGIIVAGWDKQEGGVVYNIPLGGSLHRQPFAIGGSGSTYIYGYCDAHFKDNMTKEECIEFVRNCERSARPFFSSLTLMLMLELSLFLFFFSPAISLAISRDGSSGGVIRTAVIDKDGVKRDMLPGNQLPSFWQG